MERRKKSKLNTTTSSSNSQQTILLGHDDSSHQIVHANRSELFVILRIVIVAHHELVDGLVVQELVRELAAEEQLFIVRGDGGGEAIDQVEIVFADEDAVVHVVVVAINLFHTEQSETPLKK